MYLCLIEVLLKNSKKLKRESEEASVSLVRLTKSSIHKIIPLNLLNCEYWIYNLEAKNGIKELPFCLFNSLHSSLESFC